MTWIKRIATIGATAGGFLYAVKIVLFVVRKKSAPTMDELINL